MSNEEILIKILRGEDKEHFAVVNGNGCIEIYSNKEYLETPMPLNADKCDTDKIVESIKTDSSVRLYGSGNSDNYLIPVKRVVEIVQGIK